MSEPIVGSCRFIKVWAMNTGDDDRSAGYPAWVFDDEAKARRQAKGQGWYGGDAPVGEHDAVIDNAGNVYLIDRLGGPFPLNRGKREDADIRKAALAKLTPEEQELLGLV